MAKFAVIDIGTNSVKLSIFRVFGKNIFWECDKIKNSRIGEKVAKTYLISKLGMERTLSVFDEWKSLIETVNEVKIVGTAAFRIAKNSNTFITALKQKYNLDLEIISGEKEAELSFKAIANSYQTSSSENLLIDSGGASTELIFFKKNQILEKFSYNIGAASLTENAITQNPITEKDISKAEKMIENIFQRENRKIDNLIAIGGTATSLLVLKNKFSREKTNFLNQTDFFYLKNILMNSTPNFRINHLKIEKGRADILPAGLLILNFLQQKFGKNIQVSFLGLRHGLALDWMENKLKTKNLKIVNAKTNI